MRFQVPQFIETETNVVGPFTLKQFLWIASGVAIMFLMFMILPLLAFIVMSIPVGATFGALAFVKIDNVPLFNYVTYGIAYALNPRRYFFKKTPNDTASVGDLLRTDRPAPRTSTIKAPGTEPAPAEEAPVPPTETAAPEKSPTSAPPEKEGYIEREYIIR